MPEYQWPRRIILWLGILLVIGALYDGAIFYGRWRSGRNAENARAAKEAADAQRTVDALGGGGLRILNFYAATSSAGPGSHEEICYGVMGAKTVRLEPAVAVMWPAISRCLTVPRPKNAKYKLIAEDAAGHSVTKTLLVPTR